MIAGLEEPTAGAIAIGGDVVNGVSPRDRDIAMVFQSYALYPHKTVLENLAFGLRQHKMPAAEITERVREVSSLLTLDDLLDRKPAQLSGGQRQRVAMAARSRAGRRSLFSTSRSRTWTHSSGPSSVPTSSSCISVFPPPLSMSRTTRSRP